MKRSLLATIALVAALGAAANAVARHDDKPHGYDPKVAAEQKAEGDKKAPPGVGGRHDDRPHGTVKKKSAPTKAEGKTATPKAGAAETASKPAESAPPATDTKKSGQ